MIEEQGIIVALVDKIVKLKGKIIIELEIGKESIQGEVEDVAIYESKYECVQDFKKEKGEIHSPSYT